MLVKDVMTSNVITVSSNTSVSEAQAIMSKHDFRRLPVVDNGRLVGMVTGRRLAMVRPRAQAPLVWQAKYLISRTTVGDVMRREIVAVSPTDTVEKAVAKAQSEKVGTLLVMDNDQLVGICTTNDFFYRIVNPTLGLGEPGIRLLTSTDDIGVTAEKIVACVNKLGIKVKVLWAIPKGPGERNNIILHLEYEDAGKVVGELEKLGCAATVLER
jgi:acetoin utilization protein AcuB